MSLFFYVGNRNLDSVISAFFRALPQIAVEHRKGKYLQN